MSVSFIENVPLDTDVAYELDRLGEACRAEGKQLNTTALINTALRQFLATRRAERSLDDRVADLERQVKELRGVVETNTQTLTTLASR